MSEREKQIEVAAAAIRLCPSFADFSSPPFKCAMDMAAAAVDALASRSSPERREGFKHLYTLSESEVIVAHPNFLPVIYDFATGTAKQITDLEQTP